jgi:hypothetical protein
MRHIEILQEYGEPRADYTAYRVEVVEESGRQIRMNLTVSGEEEMRASGREAALAAKIDLLLGPEKTHADV